jgi:hypothetical protein
MENGITIFSHLMSQLEQVFQRFLQTKDFQVHDRISVHLDVAILDYVQSRLSGLTLKEKAIFVMSVIPRKRITELIKPQVVELLSTLTKEPGYLGVVSQMVQTICAQGSISVDFMDKTANFMKMKECAMKWQLSIVPNEIRYLSKQSQQELIHVQEKTLIEFRTNRLNRKERFEKYGLSSYTRTPTTTPRNIELPPIRSPHTPASIFIPSSQVAASSLLRPKTPTSAPKFRKEQKMKVLELDHTQIMQTMQTGKEKALKQTKEKEKAKEKPEKVQKPKAKKRKSIDEENSPVKVKKLKNTKKRTDSSEDEGLEHSDHQDFDAMDSSRNDNFDMGPAPEDNDQEPSNVSSLHDSQVSHTPSGVALNLTPHIVPPPIQPANIDNVLAGADCVSEEERNEIAKFLRGDYTIQPHVREFKLSEKIVVVDESTRKREAMFIVLDYSNCKWKKVKRTSRIL